MDSETRKRPGALIVIEGLDRAGKTSQCHLLVEALGHQGYQVRYMRFPGTYIRFCLRHTSTNRASEDRNTPTGKMIDSYLRGTSQQDDHSIHLLFSANRWEAAQGIKADLLDGTIVIVDRYSYSGAVYSAAKGNSDLSLEWAWQPEVGLPRPDLLLFLSISSMEAAKRGGYGEERYETDPMQSRVRHLFEVLLSMNHGHNIHVVDAGFSIDQVAEKVLCTTLRLLSAKKATNYIQKIRPWQELGTPSHNS